MKKRQPTFHLNTHYATQPWLCLDMGDEKTLFADSIYLKADKVYFEISNFANYYNQAGKPMTIADQGKLTLYKQLALQGFFKSQSADILKIVEPEINELNENGLVLSQDQTKQIINIAGLFKNKPELGL